MAELIGFIVAMIIVYGIPYSISKKEEHKRLEDLYNGKSKSDDTDKWRR